jgi:hypothetical protein
MPISSKEPDNAAIPSPAPVETAQAGPGSASPVVSDVRSAASSSGSTQQPLAPSRRERIGSAARRTDQALSRTADRLRGIRNQLGGMPSDAAPHTPPPRMPIDHHE